MDIYGYEIDDMALVVGELFALIIIGCIWVVAPKMGMAQFPIWQRIIISLAMLVIAPIIVNKVGNR